MYALTGSFAFNVDKESQLIDTLKRLGVHPELLTKEEAQQNKNDIYADIMLIDYIKLKNYHRYIKVPTHDAKQFQKRIKEAEQ